jgi:hypothetical protein
MPITERISVLLLLVVFLTLRILGPVWIGRAARKRNEGFWAWIVVGLLIGPLITWILYLAFVSWKPVLPEPGAPSESVWVKPRF